MNKLGLPYHLPHDLRDLMFQGKPFNLEFQEVRRQQRKLIAQEATKVHYYLRLVPEGQLHPTPHQRSLLMEGLANTITG
jgi:hypothetical protein